MLVLFLNKTLNLFKYKDSSTLIPDYSFRLLLLCLNQESECDIQCPA